MPSLSHPDVLRPAVPRPCRAGLLALTVAASLAGCSQPSSRSGGALVVDPQELVTSAPPGEASGPVALRIDNPGGAAVTIRSVNVSGAHADRFVVGTSLPLTVPPSGAVNLDVTFVPSGNVGVLDAALRIEADGAAPLDVGLYGLSGGGAGPQDEPSLQQIVDTLGFRVDVGAAARVLPTSAPPIGQEVRAPLLRRAGEGPVTLRAVARYTPQEALSFGFYRPDATLTRTSVATVAAAAAQTLTPTLQDGTDTFDPGDELFGVFVGGASYAPRTSFTEDGRNFAGGHSARVYPARDREGRPLPHEYLLAFDQDGDGDYQDLVLAASNVEPVDASLALGFVSSTAGTPHFEAQGAAVGGRLYVFGGFDRYVNLLPKVTTRVSAFDPATGEWQARAPLPEGLTHAGVAVDGSTVYLAGGFVGDHPGPATSHVRAYDTTTDRWSSRPDLPGARGGGALVRLGRDLHFFGGTQRSGDTYLKDFGDHWVLNLDAPAQGWQSRAPLPNPRNHMAGVVIGGEILAVGGQHLGDEVSGNQSSVERYDPATDTWETRADLPLPLSHTSSSTFVWRDQVLVVGGVTNGQRKSATVWSYDPLSNRWTALSSLPAARQSPVADAVNGRVVVSGGEDQAGPTATTWLGVP
ncbi:Kelch repeat-containing protein [Deinococcus pimensis]|uniref:Kelch repeat-containing protein n=1 Tax=Deinococcus pimensis TaxID=309888 RepID=UPI000693BD84|nr:kelch repeat-containing protein [Deinococcus pimensis]